MPADFLSQNAVDAIKFDLPTYAREQDKDEILRGLCLYLLNKSLPTNNTLAQLIHRMSQDCFVLHGSCLAPSRRKPSTSISLVGASTSHFDILHEVHGHFLAGHFGISKTKEQLLQSYNWPNMQRDISDHLRKCNNCQVAKHGKTSPELLSPLPQCKEPN